MSKNTRHTLLVDKESGVVASAVDEVLSFNEREVRLSLLTGEKLTVMGEKLKINGFDKNSGEARLYGVVHLIKYSTASSSKLKRLLG